MKQTVIIYAVVLFLLGQEGFAQRQFKETIKKELSFTGDPDKSTLVIANIFGPVIVEGYAGNTILVEVKREIFAANEEWLALGKRELEFHISEQQDKIVMRPKSPYIKFKDNRFEFVCCNENGEPPYQHKLSFKVKVPKNTNLNVSAINDGDITISNTAGKVLKVNNINGSIGLRNVEGKTNVHCINGGVDITYAKNPIEPSKYYSLNGDINVTYKKALSAAISFKSFNGGLFTDFDIQKQYMNTKKTNENDGVKKFKYEVTPVVQIGSGATDFSFETFNGNVFITKI